MSAINSTTYLETLYADTTDAAARKKKITERQEALKTWENGKNYILN